MGKPNPKYDNSFSVDENCIKCGTCAKVCPMANITVTDHVEYHHNCCTCQACIHACPTHAIHFKSERNTERWRNPEVSLKEIIQANDQKNR
jgi:MinD superfamily P-loop ATPase